MLHRFANRLAGAWRGLPSWVSRQAHVRQSPVPTLLRERQKFAPGWHQLAMEFTTAESETYARPPNVDKAIRELGFIPLWCRWVFHNPNEDIGPVVFGRHAIGSYIPNPREDKSEYQLIKTHPGHKGPSPNQIDLIWMGKIDTSAPDLPGAYLPFDWPLVYELQDRLGHTARQGAIGTKKQYVGDVIEAQELAKIRNILLHEYLMREVGKFADRKMEEAGEVALKNYFSGGMHIKDKKRLYFT